MKLNVQEFSVEADSAEEAAAKVARHFGCIADDRVPDSGLAIAHTLEGVVTEIPDANPADDNTEED